MQPQDFVGVKIQEVGPERLADLLNAVLAVGGELDLPSLLKQIVEAAAALADARYAALGILDESRTALAEFITVGLSAEETARIGALPKGHGILGLLITDPEPVRLPDLNKHPDSYGFPPGHPPMKSFLGVPVRGRDGIAGNLYLTDKQTADEFSETDQRLVIAFAAAAAVAIDNARLHAQVRSVTLAEDRERIARDLHDTVMQRLFATGLSLQATERLAEGTEISKRIQAAVEDLDATIREVRAAIFALGDSYHMHHSLRAQIVTVAEDSLKLLGYVPRVHLEGPIDSVVSDETAEQLLPVLREALSNIARHANAKTVDVRVSVYNNTVELIVDDDGDGMAGASTAGGRGLRGMVSRAESLGGSARYESRDPKGTRIIWTVPVS